MEIIKKFWKYIVGAMVVLVASGALISYVMADDTPVLSVSNATGEFNVESNVEMELTATVDGLKLDGYMPAELYNTNLFWYTDNNQVVGYIKDNGTDIYAASDMIHGQTINIRSIKAGVANLSARYYYYPEDHSIALSGITSQADLDALVAAGTVAYQEYIMRPFHVMINVRFDNFEYAEDEYKVFDGNKITIHSDNAYSNDPLVVEAENGVAFITESLSYDRTTITLNEGGKGMIIARTSTGRDATNNLLIDGLYHTYIFYNKINFADSYLNSISGRKEYEVSGSNFGSVTIDSNICNDASAMVTYSTENADIATMDKSVLVPNNAGRTTITAGVQGADGQWLYYDWPDGRVESWDLLDVHVPAVWIYNGAYTDTLSINMSVEDIVQLETNAGNKAVRWVSSDPAVAKVTDTGSVTAVSYGTAVITAQVTGSDTINGVAIPFDETISVTINVDDNFALSTTSHSIQVGENFDIEAITSTDDGIVEFYIDGVPAASATGGLVGKIDVDTPKILTVTGVTEGTYQIEARYIVNNMTKRQFCTITVKTGVSDVTIAPETLKMNVGETATLRVTVGPNTAYNKDVVWVSSDPEVVSVDLENATEYEVVVTANKGGIATVTVVSTADGTKYATCTINVREAVTGIELSETDVTVNMNIIKQYQLTATVLPENTTGFADGVNRNVIWSSTNENVLTVNENGLVTFVAPGTAAVVAMTEDGGFQAYCNFVVSVPVEEVRITSDDLILNVGDELQLDAEVLPLTATNRTIEWSSTDTNVVTIDSNGTLKAVKAGHCAIFAKSLDNGAEDYINVYVRQPVSTVTLNTNEMTVTKGTVFWLYATILPENADIKVVDWSTSDPTIATVDSTGMVTALQAGVVTITATSQDTGDSDFCVVTITDPVTSITLLTGDSQTLFVGSQFTIVPEVLPIDAPNKAVTYISTNEEIATVDENGVVTALKGGECDIIVTTVERGLRAQCHITVIEYLSTITLNETFSYINIGSYIDLVATTTTDTATNKSIVWTTSNSAIATVDASGRVSGVAYGTAVITATAADGGGATATCVVQVIEPVTSITVSPTELRLIAGDTYMLVANVLPENASVKKLKWESTNPAVATVDEDGEITAVAGGKCRIVATSTDNNNVSAYCTVYVTNKALAQKLTLNSSNITIEIGETRKLTVKSTPTQITEGLGWYSTDTGVVTVDNAGNIRGIAEGVANIVVYGLESGVEGICQVTVKTSEIYATGLKLNSTEITMLSGKTRQLVARLTPLNSTENIRWYSTDTSVVVVDNTGKITTVGPGQATVVAVTELTSLESSCIVHSMAISRTSVTLQQYDPFMLYVDGAPSKVSWRTNNPRIATVSSNGEVIGRKEGTTTIIATVDGKTLSCTVTITEATKY